MIVEEICKNTENWSWNDVANAVEEEMAELTQVLCKMRRIGAEHHKPRKSEEEIKDNFLEEFADVEFCLTAMRGKLSESDLTKIEEWKEKKLKRCAN